MKTNATSLLAIALALLLCLAGTAFAEAQDTAPQLSDRLFDLQVAIGNKVYNCANTIEGLKAEGLRFEAAVVVPGRWYKVNNGRQSFEVAVDALDRDNWTEEDVYVCGYRINASDVPNARIFKDVVLGEATHKSFVEAFGPDGRDSDDHLFYTFNRRHVQAYIWFEDNGEDAPLRSVEITSSIPLRFGLGVSEQAGVEQEGLPDPSDFAFDQFVIDGKLYEGKLKVSDLLANGWRIDVSDADKELEPQGGMSYINTTDLTLFNGNGMMRAYAYNSGSGSNCPITAGTVLSVGVNVADGTSMIVADGITFGSTLDDVIATYGSNYSESEQDDYIRYTFKMGNSVRTIFNVMDGKVVYIEVQTGL